MKRHPFPLVIAAVPLLLGAAVLPLSAQRPPELMPLQFYINLGYVNLFAYPKWIDLGPELEVRLGFFSINPDLALWIGQSFDRKVKVVPGLTANVRLGHYTLGGGFVHRVSDWWASSLLPAPHGWLMPKVQIGYAAGPARLALALFFPGGDRSIAAGLTISMGLGRPSRD